MTPDERKREYELRKKARERNNDKQSERSLQGARHARSTVYKGHLKFASGDYSIEDEDRSGRPMELDLDFLQRQMEANPYQTTREPTVALGVSQTTVVRGLKSIGKVRKLGRWIPHALT
ncbi:hypothetical protein RB195_018147 [Necator americanus]|uniref:Transposase n=1 Tax=Necator americanus TaxID=51031 RepID=A0ABR1CAF0_NECAM